MGLINEFKQFSLRGNVIDLAVGVIIGGAFGKIVNSLVADIIMPMVNPIIPGGDWKTIEVGQGIKVGSFLGMVIDFVIVTFVIFLLIKAMNAAKRKEKLEPVAPVPPSNEEKLLTEIRDLLKKG